MDITLYITCNCYIIFKCFWQQILIYCYFKILLLLCKSFNLLGFFAVWLPKSRTFWRFVLWYLGMSLHSRAGILIINLNLLIKHFISLVNFVTELSSIKVSLLKLLRIFENTDSLCLANPVHNVLLVFECRMSGYTFFCGVHITNFHKTDCCKFKYNKIKFCLWKTIFFFSFTFLTGSQNWFYYCSRSILKTIIYTFTNIYIYNFMKITLKTSSLPYNEFKSFDFVSNQSCVCIITNKKHL